MQCRSCGTRLPENGIYCPGCATLTPYGISQSQATSDDPTYVPFPPYPSSLPTLPATAYGSPAYGESLQNPYEPRNPYAESPPPPPKNRKTLTVFIGVIVLLIIGGGVLGIKFYSAATSPKAHYPFSTNLVLNDPLSNDSNAATYGWGIANTSNGGCAFVNGAYEITAQQNYLYCPAHHANFSNFTYEIQLKIKAGGIGAMGGVIFRHELGTGKNYMFLLGTDGSYELDVNMGYSTKSTLRSGMISSFAIGFNQLHTIGIVANGSQISIYVDQKQIMQVSDASYASGEIGMLSSYGNSTTMIAFTNVKVWQL